MAHPLMKACVRSAAALRAYLPGYTFKGTTDATFDSTRRGPGTTVSWQTTDGLVRGSASHGFAVQQPGHDPARHWEGIRGISLIAQRAAWCASGPASDVCSFSPRAERAV